ncbi:DUF4365 domain-containing protein [Kribbella sp. NPDC050281]|uniref:DUF4365 domain-containing protein n=1 Tax=Kribbella sp. NPDC050281 TaxID=3155515 RepID=UPI0033CC0726
MLDHQTLNLSAAVGRYAVAYVRKVCSQAHIGFTEPPSGEDVLAIDGWLSYHSFDVRVQIKGSTHYSLQKGHGLISFGIEEKWRQKWRRNGQPTYFILVLMEKEVDQWFQYDPCATLAGAYALWARIDNLDPDATSVALDRAQRFTVQTVGAWHDDLNKGYGEGA